MELTFTSSQRLGNTYNKRFGYLKQKHLVGESSDNFLVSCSWYLQFHPTGSAITSASPTGSAVVSAPLPVTQWLVLHSWQEGCELSSHLCHRRVIYIIFDTELTWNLTVCSITPIFWLFFFLYPQIFEKLDLSDFDSAWFCIFLSDELLYKLTFTQLVLHSSIKLIDNMEIWERFGHLFLKNDLKQSKGWDKIMREHMISQTLRYRIAK